MRGDYPPCFLKKDLKMTCNCEKSYITCNEAVEYFMNRYGADIWQTLDLTGQRQALITATKHIDRLPFVGRKANQNQPLEFPRIYSSCSIGTEIPQAIKDATAEEALSIVQYVDANGEDVFNGAENANFQSLKLGDATINYGSNSNSASNTVNQYGLYSQEAYRILQGFIRVGYDIPNSRFYEVY